MDFKGCNSPKNDIQITQLRHKFINRDIIFDILKYNIFIIFIIFIQLKENHNLPQLF